MNEEERDAASALSALGVGPAAKEMYVDVLRPAAQIVGKQLETVARAISLAMAPVRGIVWGLEKVEDWLSAALLKRLAQNDPKDIQSPPPYVAGQLLLQLQFCSEQEQLREMYANLLASAMLRPVAPSVHPAFVQVIQQLTPDEALVLARIAKRGRNFSMQHAVTQMGRYENKDGDVSEQFRVLCSESGVQYPNMSEAYMDNLLRLKVLADQQWSEGELEPEESNRFGYFDAAVKNISGRIIEVSAFGEHFIKTCVDVQFERWHVPP